VEGDASLVIGEFLNLSLQSTIYDHFSFFLQLLAKHKYLTGDDVVAVMSYYETTSVKDRRPT